MEQDKYRWIKSFARIGTLSEKDANLIKKYEISSEQVANLNAEHVWVEIGIGNGENSINQLNCNKDIFLVSCEPYLKGLIKFVIFLEKHKITNAFVCSGDARSLIKEMKNKSVETFFILFPDPWPKKRHHKRRIVNQSMLSLMNSKLIDDGQLIISSDEPGYIQNINEQLKTFGKFDYMATDEKCIPNYTRTAYHRKALMAKRIPIFFYCQKKNEE